MGDYIISLTILRGATNRVPNRLPNDACALFFSADVAEMALDLSDFTARAEMLLNRRNGRQRPKHAESSGKPLSEDQWENPAGPRHERAIAVAENFQHHSLFPGNAAKKQRPKPDQARKTGNPVRQQ
jgi:hypothetical protein